MKILVGYDGSDASKKAVDLALRHAKKYDAQLHVVTSLLVPDPLEDQRFRQELAGLKRRFDTLGIPCQTLVSIRGLSPGEDLVQLAKEKRFDCIIIGLQKVSRFDKMLFGSNAQCIILNAPCPVITIR